LFFAFGTGESWARGLLFRGPFFFRGGGGGGGRGGRPPPFLGTGKKNPTGNRMGGKNKKGGGRSEGAKARKIPLVCRVREIGRILCTRLGAGRGHFGYFRDRGWGGCQRLGHPGPNWGGTFLWCQGVSPGRKTFGGNHVGRGRGGSEKKKKKKTAGAWGGHGISGKWFVFCGRLFSPGGRGPPPGGGARGPFFFGHRPPPKTQGFLGNRSKILEVFCGRKGGGGDAPTLGGGGGGINTPLGLPQVFHSGKPGSGKFPWGAEGFFGAEKNKPGRSLSGAQAKPRFWGGRGYFFFHGGGPLRFPPWGGRWRFGLTGGGRKNKNPPFPGCLKPGAGLGPHVLPDPPGPRGAGGPVYAGGLGPTPPPPVPHFHLAPPGGPPHFFFGL